MIIRVSSLMGGHLHFCFLILCSLTLHPGRDLSYLMRDLNRAPNHPCSRPLIHLWTRKIWKSWGPGDSQRVTNFWIFLTQKYRKNKTLSWVLSPSCYKQKDSSSKKKKKKEKKITLFPSKELSYKLNRFCFEKNLQYLSHFSHAAAA